VNKNGKKNAELQMDTTAWMVTFGDLLMLLLTFFVLLLSMSSMDVKSLKSMFSIFLGASGPLELSELKAIKSARDLTGGSGAMETSHLKMMKLLEDLTGAIGVPEGETGAYITNRKMLEDYFSEGEDTDERQILMGLESLMGISEDERGVVISLQANVLFDSGEAEVKPTFPPLLNALANILDAVSNEVLIMGHTDNVPTRNRRYRSNWELSLHRALNVHRYLVETRGLSPERFAVGGYGDLRPRFPNNTSEGREKNRRVEIILRRT
jgi:chemotaxis protein MotB